MRLILTICFLSVITSAGAQSPYLHAELSMDSVLNGHKRFKVEMKICTLKNPTDAGNWFTPDTSKIDFSRLREADVNCGVYFDNDTENKYQYGNQVFAWEKILVFKISDMSSRAWHESMYVVVPMPYKSFLTSVTLDGVVFRSGKLIFMNNLSASYKDHHLIIFNYMQGEVSEKIEGHPLEFIVGN